MKRPIRPPESSRGLCRRIKLEDKDYLQTYFVKVRVAQSCLTLCDSRDYAVHGILQSRILEWVAVIFLQGIFPTQGSNPGLPHRRWILYWLSHQGSPLGSAFCTISCDPNIISLCKIVLILQIKNLWLGEFRLFALVTHASIG